jgi:hypothetical protein
MTVSGNENLVLNMNKSIKNKENNRNEANKPLDK